MRVGDEKDPDEADTVGAITLRKEHLTFNATENIVHFHFLGKDSVEWDKELKCELQAFFNLQYYWSTCKEYLFEGINSTDVAEFLREGMDGLSAKTFRTWKATQTVKAIFKIHEDFVNKYPSWKQKMVFKEANLAAAMILNHKKALSKNYDVVLAKKQAKTKIAKDNEKATTELGFFMRSSGYNLGTSLRAYVDPRVMKEWGDRHGIDVSQFYTSALKKKFSWAW
jgi:DNA topoisomerase-1